MVDLVTSAELCETLKIHRATLHRLIHLGKIPTPIKVTPSLIRWRRDEITAWIAAGMPCRAAWEASRPSK